MIRGQEEKKSQGALPPGPPASRGAARPGPPAPWGLRPQTPAFWGAAPLGLPARADGRAADSLCQHFFVFSLFLVPYAAHCFFFHFLKVYRPWEVAHLLSLVKFHVEWSSQHTIRVGF